MKNKLYKHIIWDWNGTLVNDAWLCVEIMNNILKRRNMKTISIDNYCDLFKFPVKDYYQLLGFNFIKESFIKLGKEFIKEYKIRCYEPSLQPNVPAILNNLLAQNITHSILSAQHQTLLNQTIKFYKLDDLFIEIQGLNNYSADSKIKIGEKLISKLNIHNNKILLIGDTEHDYDVADYLNINCILISHGHCNYNRLKKTKSPVITNLLQLNNYLY